MYSISTRLPVKVYNKTLKKKI